MLRQPSWIPVLVVAALAPLGTGCFFWTSRSEGDDLARLTRTHEQRLVALESGMSQERERLRTEIERAEAQVTRLQGIIEAATRTGADVGASVAELQQRIERLEGYLAESRELADSAQRNVETLRQHVDQRLTEVGSATGVRLQPSQIPQTPAEHFAAAERELAREAYGLARALYREYVSRYATDDRADDAQHRIGVSYIREGNFASALGEFRKVLTTYPRGDALDDTLLDMAEAFFQLSACTDAKAALNALIRSHPTSPLVPRARAKLTEIERAPAARCAS